MNVGFSSLQFTAEEGVSLLEVCLRVFGPAVLSQASLVRVQTIPGSAEGIYVSQCCTIKLMQIVIIYQK